MNETNRPQSGADVRAARAQALAAATATKRAQALPGSTPPTTPTPPAPFEPLSPQPSDAERAAIEARWRLQRDVPRSLAQLIILVNAHPEWLAWARAAEGGTMEFNG